MMDLERKMDKFDKINNQVTYGIQKLLDSAIANYINELNEDADMTPLDVSFDD